LNPPLPLARLEKEKIALARSSGDDRDKSFLIAEKYTEIECLCQLNIGGGDGWTRFSLRIASSLTASSDCDWRTAQGTDISDK
jgi:hypothetical protein